MHARDPAPVHEILAAAQSVQTYPIFDKPELPQWHRGRVVLLGDAAHAVGPHAGQGASLAITDAMALAKHIRFHPDFAAAFQAYQHVCEGLVKQVARVTARNASNKRQTTALPRQIRQVMLPLMLPLGLRASRQLLHRSLEG